LSHAGAAVLRAWPLLLALLCASPQGLAAGWPAIEEIRFAGNEVTRAETMRRELLIRPGDPADPAQIERSRQAIQDLGLFRSVTARTLAAGRGVVVEFSVREKWRVIPAPRIEGNDNGDYGYGGQLRWNNVWGLNHTVNVQAMRRTYKDQDKTAETTAQLAYSIPFLGSTPYGLSGALSLDNRSALDPLGRPYRESMQNAQLLGSYALSAEHPSTGWSVAGGLGWQRDAPSGEFAPGPISNATGPMFSASYNELHYQIYSEQGQRWRWNTQFAVDGLASTYSFWSSQVSYRGDWHLGTTPHQTLEFLANSGIYSGGAPGHAHDFYALGGQRSLRGYPSAFIEGDCGYYLAAAWLRPVFADWLRVLLIAEAGNSYADVHHLQGPATYASVGLGLRLRVNWLINLELELGAAMPLTGSRGLRPFAGTVDSGR
jgi:outer membrane protein assembly factor BamA